MLLFWKIRYLDTRDRQFKDRCLWLDTNSLDPVTKVAVEATYQLKGTGRDREILRYRSLFKEERPNAVAEHEAVCGGGFCLTDYFEDENGRELDLKRMAVTLTGNPDAVFFPPGTPPHMIEFCLAEKPPIDLHRITLTPDQLSILGYFARDLREIMASAVFKDGPGRLTGSGPG